MGVHQALVGSAGNDPIMKQLICGTVLAVAWTVAVSCMADADPTPQPTPVYQIGVQAYPRAAWRHADVWVPVST